jgi:transcription antitermination protein NusB
MSKKSYNPFARRQSRQFVLQGLYAWYFAETSKDQILTYLKTRHDFSKVDLDYFNCIFFDIFDHFETLDLLITPYLDRKFSELDPIELIILRIGTYELLYRQDVPSRVVINESVELAKVFGATESHKYINGIMDKVARQLREKDISQKLI